MLNLIIIEPLKLIFEIVFHFALKATNSVGVSIVFLSLVLNIILMPLYKKAEDIQNQENDIQQRLKPGVEKIKKAFKGDEQYMILQTYYRQNNYKPIYSLRSIVSLLLEIPFFIAAYSFISKLSCLKNHSFIFINDLGAPDGILFGLNTLPIAMTLINIVSCIVYTKGQPMKSKIQLYIMSLLFLILLYDAPSGLALYYLLNNLFSLVKNVISKSKNRKKCISCILLTLSGFLVYYTVSSNSLALKLKVVILLISVLIFYIGICLLFEKNIIYVDLNGIEYNKHLFLICCIFMAILVGLLIPSQVVNASPEEFIDRLSFINPLEYIYRTFLLSFGFFVVWLNIYYLLMNKNVKKIMSICIFCICVISIVNHLFFKQNLGLISNALLYENYPEFSNYDYILNIFVLSACVFVSILLLKFNITKRISLIACLCLAIMFAINAININVSYEDVLKRKDKFYGSSAYLPLSKTEKNIIVIMLDRAINMYYPYILNEKPVLQKQFAGFTYYPNTISFGGTTNIGAPALFGGYEYTPEEINRRDRELLADKHNEALKVMPVIFDSNGYDVTVCDPPYAGYTWIPDLSIFDDYPNIKTFITEDKNVGIDENKLTRNLLCYGITRICPTLIFSTIYNSGNYMAVVQSEDISTALYNFIGKYNVLCELNKLSIIGNDRKSFIMLQNSTTHEPAELQLPNYTIENIVDNSLYLKENTEKQSILGDEIILENEQQIIHYHANMASMLRLGEWFDFLRRNDVYDNTRIIIVSDHGRSFGQNEKFSIDGVELMTYNSLLLIKDFNDDELKIDSTLMTTADVLYFATKGVIINPVNPFTEKPIVEKEKDGANFHIYNSSCWDTTTNNGNTFINDGIWYSVHDNSLDVKNWEIIEDPNK